MNTAGAGLLVEANVLLQIESVLLGSALTSEELQQTKAFLIPLLYFARISEEHELQKYRQASQL